MDKKTQFLIVYAHMPPASREEIVVVVENKSISWNSAKLEVEKNTPLGVKIIEILPSLKVLL